MYTAGCSSGLDCHFPLLVLPLPVRVLSALIFKTFLEKIHKKLQSIEVTKSTDSYFCKNAYNCSTFEWSAARGRLWIRTEFWIQNGSLKVPSVPWEERLDPCNCPLTHKPSVKAAGQILKGKGMNEKKEKSFQKALHINLLPSTAMMGLPSAGRLAADWTSS